MAVTVATIRTNAKAFADMEKSKLVSDTLWLNFINKGYKRLYDLLVSKFEDYYVGDPTAFTVVSGASSYSLPADFYKLRGVDRDIGGGEYVEIFPFNFVDRNRKRLATRFRSIETRVRYRIVGNKLIFTPADLAPGSYQLWYVPRATDLTQDSDTVDGVNGWEEYIELDAAIKALIKEESDPSALMAERAKIEERIETMAANRDVGQSHVIADVSNYNWYEDYI